MAWKKFQFFLDSKFCNIMRFLVTKCFREVVGLMKTVGLMKKIISSFIFENYWEKMQKIGLDFQCLIAINWSCLKTLIV